MKNVRAILLSTLTVGALGALAMACTSNTDAATSDSDFTSESNTDVQVIEAKSGGQITWGFGGGTLDASKCVYTNKKPYNSASGEFTATAEADCTEALTNLRGPTVNPYKDPETYIRESPNLSHASFRHWCTEAEIIVAVKAAAWDNPSFEGIGFYGYERTMNAKPDARRTFYKKTDTRLKRVGEATLKKEGHQKVYLYRFIGAGPCQIAGTSGIPNGGFEFKPHATFQGGHERWENVPANHTVAYKQSWNRRGELLD